MKSEQYNRRNCLRISGLPEVDPASENTEGDIVNCRLCGLCGF